MSDDSPVPSYEPMLAAYHRAFERELRAMVGILPIEVGHTVLDMACGDGACSVILAERVGASGRVVAVDLVPKYLELAGQAVRKAGHGAIVELAAASIDELPFEAGTFNLCWCAQSLYSLPDPAEALRRLLRVTRPGGVVGVLESDTLHRVILPWPVEVELSIRAAELRALVEDKEPHRKFYVGRELRRIFREAGIEGFEQRTIAIDRLGPFTNDERTYFAEYIKRLAEQAGGYLDGSIRADFQRLVDPNSKDYLLDDRDVTVTCIDHLVWGRKPL